MEKKNRAISSTVANIMVVVLGMVFYIQAREAITPVIQTLYRGNPNVFYSPTHFGDARQYVFICIQGYSVPPDTPTTLASRLSWMPIYPLLQCALHNFTGISMVYVAMTLSAVAMGFTLLLTVSILRNLHIRYPALHAFAVLLPIIGAPWLYLPGAESTYLCIGMAVLWLITLPKMPHSRNELVRVLIGLILGIVLMLTKPNALALLLPLGFAFLYRSWEKSKQAGYLVGLWPFTADVVIDHLRPILRVLGLLKADKTAHQIRYDWTSLTVSAGIVLGFAFWLAYSSFLSGVPFYFLKQQLEFWGRAWATGNMREMLMYFAQAFHSPERGKPWNYGAAWSLAAVLSALIPAASTRVPTLIRGMLWVMIVFMLFTGTAHYASDRYIASTMLVGIGWACWLAGQSWKATGLRWSFVLLITSISAYLLVAQMMPLGEPRFWGIVPDNGLVLW